MKRLYCLLIFCLPAALYPADASFALGKIIPAKTSGSSYPHILKAETYTFNTRSIKALKSRGSYLWIGTTRGALRYDTATADDYEIFDNQNALLSNGIFTIKFDRLGLPWIGTYGGGISRYDGKTWVNINTPRGLADAFVFDIEFTPETVWVATWSGVNRIRGDPMSRQSWTTFTVENTQQGLLDDWVYAIEIGKDGRVWFGTESGLSMFDGTTWRSWNHEDGLGAPYNQVKKDNEGVVSAFQGTHHAHAAAYPDRPAESRNHRPNYILSMLLDQRGNLWIGTWGGGLTLFDTQDFRLRNFTKANGLPGNFVLALKEDSQGNLWIGTNNGLSRFDGKTFTNFSKINGLSSDFIFSVEFGPGHSIWVGGHSRMNRLTIDPATRELIRIE